MNEKDKKFWISMVWAHFRRSRNEGRLVRTRFWKCVQATVAVFFDFYDPSVESSPDNDIAWFHRGYVHTDCGDGEAFEILSVRGFKYALSEDSTI